MGLPGLNQYYARINLSCSWTQRSDAGEAQTRSPSVLSQALLALSHCAPYTKKQCTFSWLRFKFFNFKHFKPLGTTLIDKTCQLHIFSFLLIPSNRKYGFTHGKHQYVSKTIFIMETNCLILKPTTKWRPMLTSSALCRSLGIDHSRNDNKNITFKTANKCSPFRVFS